MSLSEHGFRVDGRRPDQIRNVSAALGESEQADGSVILEHGNTKVMCAVFGPHEAAQRGRMLDDEAIVNVQFSQAVFSSLERRRRPRGDRRASNFAHQLEQALQALIITAAFPRSQIDVYCEVIQADGGLLAACMNAAGLALASAGIPMRGLPCAVSAAFVDDEVCIDLSAREETDTLPRMTVATVAGTDKMVMMDVHNRIHVDDLPKMLRSALDATQKVHACLRAVLLDHTENCVPAL